MYLLLKATSLAKTGCNKGEYDKRLHERRSRNAQKTQLHTSLGRIAVGLGSQATQLRRRPTLFQYPAETRSLRVHRYSWMPVLWSFQVVTIQRIISHQIATTNNRVSYILSWDKPTSSRFVELYFG